MSHVEALQPLTGPDGVATANLRGTPWSFGFLRAKIEDRIDESRDLHFSTVRASLTFSTTRTHVSKPAHDTKIRLPGR
jgi:hypothetical protein